jgi:uncharacterized damage-inducible protein DinB
MARPSELKPFYEGWSDHQQKLLDTLRPLTPAQIRLRPAPGEWAIWRLASNIAGGRLYWLCAMLGEDNLGLSISGLSLEWWEDNEDRAPTAQELIDAFVATWRVVEACFDRWGLADLQTEVTTKDGSGRVVTPGWVIQHLMRHEFHHGSEIALILRTHGLPTFIAG